MDDKISDEAERIRIIDAHEHLMSEQERLSHKIDLFSYWLIIFASSDLVSAGMPLKVLSMVRDSNQPIEKRWLNFKPYWQYAKNTTHGRVLLIAARDLFGIEDINDESWRELSEKVTESNRPGWYKYVLKEKAGIDVALENRETYGYRDPTQVSLYFSINFEDILSEFIKSTDVDREYFVPVVDFSPFIISRSLSEISMLGEFLGISIHSLDNLLEALDIGFHRKLDEGMVGIKNWLAYIRPLKFDKTSKYDAERTFNRIFDGLGEGLTLAEAKPLQDYMFHEIIKRAIKYNVPLQIHTGLFEGYGNIVSNSNPLHLINLFFEYREAKFDIFHGSYPYCSELATLAKNFSNVYVDLCWLHVISPTVAKSLLHELIETVPSNKILGFGGDYYFVEGTYAHSRIARKVIAEVLSEKVDKNYLSRNEAIELIKRFLRENIYNLYMLEERWKK